MSNDSPIIHVREIQKSYKQTSEEIPVIKGLDLVLGKGRTAAILGKSGSGKSTLLSLLAGLDQVDSGAIQISDTDITKLSEADLAEFRGNNIGIVFQQFHLMEHLTALENICLPLEIHGNNSTEEGEKLLDQIGLAHRRNHFPPQLSGGERQRVAIGRALVTQPALLLADEPSGNLDNETGETITKLLFDLVETHQMTMILVTHDESLAEKCETIYTLSGGKLLNKKAEQFGDGESTKAS